MFSFLCTVVTTKVTQLPAFWLFICLIVLAIGCFVYISVRQYLFKKKCLALQENIVIGDKIKTFSGVLGEVVKIETQGEMKIVTLKNLDKEHEGYLSIDSLAICALLDETPQSAEKKTH